MMAMLATWTKIATTTNLRGKREQIEMREEDGEGEKQMPYRTKTKMQMKGEWKGGKDCDQPEKEEGDRMT